MTRRQGRRRKRLLDDLKDRRGYCELKEKALDRTVWRNRFARGFGPVVWQITDVDDDCVSLHYGEVHNSPNNNNCSILHFRSAIFYVAPTCFGALLSPSSGSRHQNFFKIYTNKTGHNKHIYIYIYGDLFCYSLLWSKSLCQLHEHGEITAPKHVGATWEDFKHKL